VSCPDRAVAQGGADHGAGEEQVARLQPPGTLAKGEARDDGGAGDRGQPESEGRPLPGQRDAGERSRQRHDAEHHAAVRGTDTAHSERGEARESEHEAERRQCEPAEHGAIRQRPAQDEEDGTSHEARERRPRRRDEPGVETLEREARERQGAAEQHDADEAEEQAEGFALHRAQGDERGRYSQLSAPSRKERNHAFSVSSAARRALKGSRTISSSSDVNRGVMC
jgi:hypothetical protein